MSAPAAAAPAGVAFNDRVLIVGATGSGKSALAQRLALSMRPQLRVVDPKGRLQLGVAPARDVRSIDWRSRIVHYVPARPSRAAFERVYDAFFSAPGPAVVWTDEAGQGIGPTTGNYAPGGLIALQAQGRELGLGHIACAQRPQTIAVVLRSEADHVFVFPPPPIRRDLELLGAELGLEADALERRLRELQAREGIGPRRLHAFLWFERATGELHDCAPLRLR